MDWTSPLVWIALFAIGNSLLMSVGAMVLLWRSMGVTDQVLARMAGQVTAVPAIIAPPPSLPAAPVNLPPVVVAPTKPAGPFTAAPPWFQAALHEIGFHETGDNQGLDRYIAMAHTGANGQPWCAIFANAMLETSGIPGTRSASSQSFKDHPAFVQLPAPALGCIVVFWRGSGPSSGIGHVGFYRGEDAARIWTLGGNENDMVQIEALPKSAPSFGLVGYFWPKSFPMPTGGPVLMPSGSPISIKTAPDSAAPTSAGGKQTGITATVFDGDHSAYGGAISTTEPICALPYRFTGERPLVRVTKGNLSVVCKITDVGPWNINDPYWQTGTRPQAETGADLGQVTNGVLRRTNKAGIDLNSVAAEAIQLDGKGLVDWEFLQPVSSDEPTVT